MDTITIIVNGAPYGNEEVWNALRLATASISASIGMGVNIFLLGNAVSAAKKGQKPPEGYYNLEKMLADLLKAGAKVAACGTCLNARAILKEALIDGIEVGTMLKLAGWIKESSKVLSF
ncbi:MAG TPA: DsrE family protein [Candidatus Acidoferrales bacterium]|nr:DsrE family protein [Candidatus Acidoferrales bacterium]